MGKRCKLDMSSPCYLLPDRPATRTSTFSVALTQHTVARRISVTRPALCDVSVKLTSISMCPSTHFVAQGALLPHVQPCVVIQRRFILSDSSWTHIVSCLAYASIQSIMSLLMEATFEAQSNALQRSVQACRCDVDSVPAADASHAAGQPPLRDGSSSSDVAPPRGRGRRPLELQVELPDPLGQPLRPVPQLHLGGLPRLHGQRGLASQRRTCSRLYDDARGFGVVYSARGFFVCRPRSYDRSHLGRLRF